MLLKLTPTICVTLKDDISGGILLQTLYNVRFDVKNNIRRCRRAILWISKSSNYYDLFNKKFHHPRVNFFAYLFAMVLISSTFITWILGWYFGAKKLQREHFTEAKNGFTFVIFGAKILYLKCVRKTLMKLTDGVNFANILGAAFSDRCATFLY